MTTQNIVSAQHTPGPWRVFNHSWSDTSILADGFDHAICLLDINHATEESQDADEALMAANARLIAAAPDMLAALRAVISVADRKTDEFDLAHAALAKATGSAS